MATNDNLQSKPGISIREVLGIGTAENGLGYVECQIREEPHPILILFPQGAAEDLCQAFSSVAANMSPDQKPADLPVPVRDARLLPCATGIEWANGFGSHDRRGRPSSPQPDPKVTWTYGQRNDRGYEESRPHHPRSLTA